MGRPRSIRASMTRLIRSISLIMTSAYSVPADLTSWRRSWAAPRMAPRGFLISWAMPSAMLPTAASRSPRRTSSSSCLTRERSRTTATAPASSPVGPGNGEAATLTPTVRPSGLTIWLSPSEWLSPVRTVSARRWTRRDPPPRISSRERPWTRRAERSINSSAAGFQRITRRERSTPTTPSGIPATRVS
jgi:hypothetical protein